MINLIDMLYLIPIGLIGSGIGSSCLTWKNYVNLKQKINSEPIYTYPDEINNINSYTKTDKKIILKIPTPYNFDLKNSKYLIGEITLEKVTPHKIVKKYNDIEFNKFSNKFEKIKKHEIINEFKSEAVKKQLLFPNIYPELILPNDLSSLNNIKVLFNNTSTIKSDNPKIIFDLYNKNIKKNIPNYCSDSVINYGSEDSFQIKKNFLLPCQSLFLLVDSYYTLKHFKPFQPFQPFQPSKKEFNIEAISDSKESILNYKYKNENNNIVVGTVLSSLLLSGGILSGLILLNAK